MAHPATIAATGLCRTVDTLLLGESDWCSVILDGLHGLLSSSCSEGPAGTTSSLALDGADLAKFNPVDGEVA